MNTPTSATKAKTRLVRVERAVYFDAVRTDVFFAAVPEDATDGAIAYAIQHHDFEECGRTLPACHGRVVHHIRGEQKDVIASLDPTGGIRCCEYDVENATPEQLTEALR